MDVLDKINNLTPLAIIGLLSWVVYLLVSKHGPVKTIANNHLHSLPDMAASLQRIETLLNTISEGITVLRTRSEFDRRRGA